MLIPLTWLLSTSTCDSKIFSDRDIATTLLLTTWESKRTLRKAIPRALLNCTPAPVNVVPASWVLPIILTGSPTVPLSR